MTSPRSPKYGTRRVATRLAGFEYRGPFRYFITLTAYKEKPFFADEATVKETIRALSETAGRYGFDVLCYCFMPEHAHLLLEGGPTSDLREFVRLFKQKSSYRHKRSAGDPLWQRGYYDRVLREDEDSLVVARYILANPVRRGLTDNAASYPNSGSFVCSVPDILYSVMVGNK
ncbi:MAG TPA: transposase [bacterium]|nr:transposase [bacterium]